MKPLAPCPRRRGSGFTLVEVLVAVTLTLIMMAAVVQIFGVVGRSINESRAALELSDRLRNAAARLRDDLRNVTAEMNPPLSPDDNQGYFEYIEGPMGIAVNDPPGATIPLKVPINIDEDYPGIDPLFALDTTVNDTDDILMFTVRSPDSPFVGRVRTTAGLTSVESPVAEVAWFVRGRTLYRRVLLVVPDFDWDLTTPGDIDPLTYAALYTGGILSGLDADQQGFFNNYDLSVRWDNANQQWIPNTLADLTNRENRFAHGSPQEVWDINNWATQLPRFPYHPHLYFDAADGLQLAHWYFLGLPTLCECSSANWWPLPTIPRLILRDSLAPPLGGPPEDHRGDYDAWLDPLPYETSRSAAGDDWSVIDRDTGALGDPNADPNRGYINPDNPVATDRRDFLGPRVAEDVILTNVIGFDVKAWDPEAPIIQEGAGPVLKPGDPRYAMAWITGAPATIGYGAYVDLDYTYDIGPPWTTHFSDSPHSKSRLTIDHLGTVMPGGTYDTWSTHYENNGVDEDGAYGADSGTNGFDDDGDGVVDDEDELDTSPPYPVPLRGIQVKIRVFEPDSRQIREITIIQDFLPR